MVGRGCGGGRWRGWFPTGRERTPPSGGTVVPCRPHPEGEEDESGGGSDGCRRGGGGGGAEGWSGVHVLRVGNAEVDADHTRVPFSFRGPPRFPSAPSTSLVPSPPRSRRRAGGLPLARPTRASASAARDPLTAVCGRARKSGGADEPSERTDDATTEEGHEIEGEGEAEFGRRTAVVVVRLVEVVVMNGPPSPLPRPPRSSSFPFGDLPFSWCSR